MAIGFCCVRMACGKRFRTMTSARLWIGRARCVSGRRSWSTERTRRAVLTTLRSYCMNMWVRRFESWLDGTLQCRAFDRRRSSINTWMQEKPPLGFNGTCCLVCGREWGPHFRSCCGAGSLVGISRTGLLRKRVRYFDLNGTPLEASELAARRERARNMATGGGRQHEHEAKATVAPGDAGGCRAVVGACRPCQVWSRSGE